MVESIVRIPGSGEFVYDTKIQTKSRISEHGKKVNSKKSIAIIIIISPTASIV